ARALDLPEATADSLFGLALLTQAEGQVSVARALLEESLTIWQRFGKRSRIATVACALGDVAWTEQEMTAAWSSYQRSLTLFRELGDGREVARLLARLARVTRARAGFDRSIRLHAAANVLCEKLGLFIPSETQAERERDRAEL